MVRGPGRPSVAAALRAGPRAALGRWARSGAGQPDPRRAHAAAASVLLLRSAAVRGGGAGRSRAGAMVLAGGAGAIAYLAYAPAGDPAPHPFNQDRNAVWLEHRWLERAHEPEEMERLLSGARARGVAYVYPAPDPVRPRRAPAAARPRADAPLPGRGPQGGAGDEGAALGGRPARGLQAHAPGHHRPLRPQPAPDDGGRVPRPHGRGVRRGAPQHRARGRRQRGLAGSVARAAHGGRRQACSRSPRSARAPCACPALPTSSGRPTTTCAWPS